MKPQFTKGSVYKDGQYYYFKTRDRVNKKQIKRCTYQTTFRLATAEKKKILETLNAEAGQPVKVKKDSINTVNEMLDLYYETVYLQNLKIHSPEKQKTMISGTLSRFDHLRRHLGTINPKNLCLNTINEYIAARRDDLKPNGAHYSDGSINFELNLLKASVKVLPNGDKFNVRENIKEHNKLTQVEREVFLSDEQYENMLQKFREYDAENRGRSNYGLFIEVLRMTGVRWGQMQLLEWSDVNWTEKRLEFAPEKTKHEQTKKHLVYLNTDILFKLKKLSNSREFFTEDCNCSKSKTCNVQRSDFVFVNQNRRCEHFGKDMFYVLWNRFCEELGYTETDKFKKAEKVSQILPHDIRRTYIIKMIGFGFDRSFIMSQTGHKSHKTFDKYNIVQEDTMKSVVERHAELEKESKTKVENERKDFNQAYQNEMDKIWDTK